MENFRYYPVIDCDSEGKEKAALFPCYNKETVSRHHRVWLEELVPNHYRLCAREAYDKRTYGFVALHCPKCNGKMDKVIPITDGHRLGLFICPKCSKE